MRRDGFVVPILVTPTKGGKFEVISGNHRFMAANELGLKEIPCVVSTLSARDAKRLAVNLNTIHGEPNPELLAPFLAEMDAELLREIHLEPDAIKSLAEFDESLGKALAELELPDSINRGSPSKYTHVCKCPKCGVNHVSKT